MPTIKDPLSVVQAAAMLGVNGARVRALITAERLTATKVGNQWVIAKADLAAVRDRKPGRPRTKPRPRRTRG